MIMRNWALLIALSLAVGLVGCAKKQETSGTVNSATTTSLASFRRRNTGHICTYCSDAATDCFSASPSVSLPSVMRTIRF